MSTCQIAPGKVGEEHCATGVMTMHTRYTATDLDHFGFTALFRLMIRSKAIPSAALTRNRFAFLLYSNKVARM